MGDVLATRAPEEVCKCWLTSRYGGPTLHPCWLGPFGKDGSCNQRPVQYDRPARLLGRLLCGGVYLSSCNVLERALRAAMVLANSAKLFSEGTELLQESLEYCAAPIPTFVCLRYEGA